MWVAARGDLEKGEKERRAMILGLSLEELECILVQLGQRW
jgi:hypothetical protein